MKKLVSVLLIVMMVLALSVPALAADKISPEPEISDVTVAKPEVGDAMDASGEKVELEVSAPELAAGETLESVAEDALKAAEDAGVAAEDVTAAEVFDIAMSDGSQPTSDVTVTIVREKSSGKVAAVMYQAEDGTWDSAKFTDNGDGTVTITFEHFCTVVLLVEEASQAPDVPVDPDKPAGPSGSGSGKPTSPQTGYD